MEEENKKNRIGLIIGVIVSALLIAITGYTLWRNVDKKEDTSKDTNRNEQKEEQVVALDKNSTLVKELIEGIKPYPCLDTYFYEDKNSNLLAENLEFQRKYLYAIQRLKNVEIVADPEYANRPQELEDGIEHWMFKVSEEEMEKALRNALGDDAILDKKSFLETEYRYTFVLDETGKKKYGDMSLTYDASNKTFTVKMNNGGGCGSGNDLVQIESASKKGKIITIVEKVMLVEEIGEVETAKEFGVYADLGHQKEIGRVNIDEFFENPDVANKYLKQAMTVTYTFQENEDGSYHFVSSKMVN